MIKEFLLENNIDFIENESLKNHTSFKVGGLADYITTPSDIEKTKKLLEFLQKNDINYYILGKGSNVIFREIGFKGVIIKTSNMQKIDIDKNNDTVTAYSGVTLNVLCKFLLDNSLSGLEFCYGIPGNVGGATYMNAGAYGGEISDCIEEITYIDQHNNICKISKDKAQFGYRNSVFQQNNWFIIACRFKLKKGDKAQMLIFMNDIMKKRKDKQPVDRPSAGSSFKRPQGHFAAALIEQCGLKGKTVGGAQISEKHSGFIINIGNATSDDIENLAAEVEIEVYNKTGVKLEKEMIII